tara:strand:+ start:4964 stop:6949 length:1986 start_codon:yes stop_codon:yes gene_type:complete
MVKSRLDTDIFYEESKSIDKEDYDYEAPQFEMELMPNVDATIALGMIKYTFIDKNIMFVPVYLVHNDKIIEKIGIYEFFANKSSELKDDDGDIDISLMDDPLPLYYSYVTPKRLLGLLSKDGVVIKPVKSISEKKVEEALDDDFLPGDDIINTEMREREQYKSIEDESWIKRYMKNSHYSLLDVEADGDCFFATIREAYKDMGKNISVADLRKIVSDSATDKELGDQKEHYDMYNKALEKSAVELEDIIERVSVLKVQFETEPSRDGKKILIAEHNDLKKQEKQLEKDIQSTKKMADEFKWLRGIKTLEDMKKIIKTKDYWAETWAIKVIERSLNIKIIILSSHNYGEGYIDNVLLCGDMVDDDIENAGIYKPDHYVIISHSINHYMLIKYNNKGIFTFETLPPSIKNIIIDKCLEKNAGIYGYIPEFVKMKENMGNAGKPKTDTGAEDIGLKNMEKFDDGYDNRLNIKFDKDTVFQFHSKSQNVRPGKGSGEKIKTSKILDFSELATIPNWRRILSNFYKLKKPFVLDYKRWRSVEHYYHGSKFKKHNKEFYALFSIDSSSKMSEDPAMAKAAAGKSGKYKGKQIRPINIKLDPTFFSNKDNEHSMYIAQMAKYKSDATAKKTLLATRDAKLEHFVRGREPIVFYNTMKIRELLNNNLHI